MTAIPARPPGPPTDHPDRAFAKPVQPYRMPGWFKDCEWCYATLCSLVGVTAVAIMAVFEEVD